MITPGTCTDRVVALTQQTPLPVTVDQDTSLVKDPVQEERRVGLHPLQMGDVDRTAGDPLQPDGELEPRRGAIVGERDQQVEIRARILVASCQRAIEHGKANALLRAECPAKPGEKGPMNAKVLALT